ncbi:MAG: hypothetical protein OQK82_05025, partial [Candidatus Pacearchaeota archaeon]|nr:hypothetical protein [Candidatus Pacearchaeota archaeon]
GIVDYNTSLNEIKRAIVSLFGGGKKDMISLIIAVLDIIAGSILLLSLFASQQIPFLSTAIWGVVVYLIARIVYTLFLNNITYGKQIEFQPDFLSWLLLLLLNTIVVLVLIKVSKE